MRRPAAFVASFLLTASLCVAAGYYRELLALPRVVVTFGGVVTNDFTIRFLTGTFPTNLVLGLTPANTNAAQYDPGNGTWYGFTSRTITLAAASSYISFRGAWTNSSRTYQAMFSDTFNTNTYTCRGEGAFSNTPATSGAYRDMFYNGKAIKSFVTNPLPILTGAPAANMFAYTLYGCSGLTSLPDGTFNTTSITGAPAGFMFNNTLRGCSGLTSLPDGTFNTTSITGAPAGFMFNNTLYGCSGLTSLLDGMFNTTSITGAPAEFMFNNTLYGCSGLTSLPDGTFNTTSITGAPAVYMFAYTLYGCSKLADIPANAFYLSNISGNPTNALWLTSTFDGCTNLSSTYTLNLSSNLTWNSTNVSTMSRLFYNCSRWGGQVMWGTNVLALAITNPASDQNVFYKCTNMPNYSTIGVNWK